jgi:hypothetical protein
MYNNNSFTDKFDRKKTLQNEKNKLQNIHATFKYRLSIPTYQPSPTKSIIPIIPTNSIYQFNRNISTNVSFQVSGENNDNTQIPKIVFKEVPIPSYFPTDKFDLNEINNNISAPIHMNIINPVYTLDAINEDIINSLKKKNIYKICHVYQEKYADNLYPTGFGDFIRSCFFIIQFCI